MHTSDLGILVLRLAVGLIFAAHGAQKVFGWWSGPGWAGWQAAVERMGMRPTWLWATASAAAELGGGLLLAIGLLTPLAAAILVAQSVVIVAHVHLPRGFWVTKGGAEFGLSLAGGVVAILLTGPGQISLDRALRLSFPEGVLVILLVLGLLAGLLAYAVPRLAPRSVSSAGRAH